MVVLTISEVKPFLAGQLCQVNFQKFSSLTISSVVGLGGPEAKEILKMQAFPFLNQILHTRRVDIPVMV